MATRAESTRSESEGKPSLVDIAEEAIRGVARNRPPPPRRAAASGAGALSPPGDLARDAAHRAAAPGGHRRNRAPAGERDLRRPSGVDVAGRGPGEAGLVLSPGGGARRKAGSGRPIGRRARAAPGDRRHLRPARRHVRGADHPRAADGRRTRSLDARRSAPRRRAAWGKPHSSPAREGRNGAGPPAGRRSPSRLHPRAHHGARPNEARPHGKGPRGRRTSSRPGNRPRHLHSRRHPRRAQQRHLPAPEPGPARDAVAGGHAAGAGDRRPGDRR